MIVHVGSVLHGYTAGKSDVEAAGKTLGAVLDDLDRRYPGLKFRVIDEQDAIRPHMRIWIGTKPARALGEKVGAGDEVHILGALSGG
jgi:molybdopterin converting factor small subunit